MSARIASDCDELLSNTDCPSHTGQASWCSSRSARAAGESSGRDRTTSTTIAIATTTSNAPHGRSLRDLTSILAGLAHLAGARGFDPCVELGDGRRAEVAAHGETVGADDVRLG